MAKLRDEGRTIRQIAVALKILRSSVAYGLRAPPDGRVIPVGKTR